MHIAMTDDGDDEVGRLRAALVREIYSYERRHTLILPAPRLVANLAVGGRMSPNLKSAAHRPVLRMR